MKQSAPLYALNGGEVSKIALTRVDIAKMRLAASCQVNWMPWVIGPMSMRPGLYYVGEVLGDAPTKLVPFVYSKLDTAILEFTSTVSSGSGTMRIFIDEVLLTRPTVSTAIANPTFQAPDSYWSTVNTTSGASAAISGGLRLTCAPIGGLAQVQQTVAVADDSINVEHGLNIVVANGPVTVRVGSTAGADDLLAQAALDTGNHALSFTPATSQFVIQIESTDAWQKSVTSCSIAPAGPVELQSNYGYDDLPNIRFDQSGDIVYAACYQQRQQVIQRRGIAPGARGWSIAKYRSGTGPFNQTPPADADLTPSVYYGNGTLTSTRPLFDATQIGVLYRLFSSGQNFQSILGAQNAYTPAVRVTGVGSTRNYSWTISGTWAGTITFQRSYDSDTTGFIDVSSVTANGSINSSTGGTGGSPDLDNVIAWERVGFKAGNYTSGSATAVSNYSGGGGYGTARVTSVVSPTVANVEVISPFSSLNATTDWLQGEWNELTGGPSAVCFHEGRLCWFGGNQAWLSASDDFTNYADINPDGSSTGDGGAIDIVLGSGPVDTISWGLSLTRLQLGREESITSIRSSNFDSPLTPTAVVARDCSDQGAERLPAIKVGKRGIFVQQSGRKVFELSFSSQELDYDDRDLTRLNLDIGVPGFVDIAKQVQPDHQIWFPRGDGMAACLLYDPKDEVECWWRMMTLGIVENVCVLPQGGLEDLVYFVVRRVINGQTVRYIERLAPRENCVGGAINQQLDCHAVYQGAPATSITLAQLPNTPVSVWADGAFIGTGTTNGAGVLSPLPDGLAHSNIVAGLAGTIITAAATTALLVGTQYDGYPAEVFADIGGTGEPTHIGAITVSGGYVTLPNGQSASSITACLGYVAPFLSAKLAYGAQLGSALTMRKRIDHVGLVMYDTGAQALQMGQRIDKLDPLPLIEDEQLTPAGTVWSEYDEPMVEIPGDWRTDSRVCLLAQAPNPVMIGGIVVSIKTSER